MPSDLTIPKLTELQKARFWSKVKVKHGNDCWDWCAGKFDDGYGAYRIGRRIYRAHRVALSIIQTIPSGALVLHSCDNPICCNPYHLRIGTHVDNMQDVVIRGRFNGVSNGRSVLNPQIVREIRTLAKTHTQTELATKFNVAPSTISSIVRRVTWRHI